MAGQLQVFAGFESSSEDKCIDGCRWTQIQSGARIVWNEDGKPMRLIAPRSKRPVGKYNSRKAGRFLAHESRGHGLVGGEKLGLMICEIDPHVDDVRSQHLRFDLIIDGTLHEYYPDMVRLMHDGTVEVVEVKKDDLWKRDRDYRMKIEAARALCRELGMRFTVWTHRLMVPIDRVRENIVRIQMDRRARVDDAQIILATAHLRSRGGEATMGDLKDVLDVGCRFTAEAAVRAMMCRGHLVIALDQRHDDDAQVALFERCRAPLLEHAA